MIHAYFDDSGLSDRSMVSLCGFTAPDDSCQRLAEEWAELTTTHGLGYLHTSAFLCGNEEYRHLGLSREQRERILQEFIMCLRRHAASYVSVAVHASAIEKVGADLTPLKFCLYRVIRRTIEQVLEWGTDTGPLAMVFDDSQEAIDFHRAFFDLRRLRPEVGELVGAYSFADDKRLQCLQAADMLACLTTKEYRRGDAAWVDGPYRNLLFTDQPPTAIPPKTELWTEETLTAALYKELSRRVGRSDDGTV